MVDPIDAFGHWLPEDTYNAITDVRPDGALGRMSDPEYLWEIETRLSDLDEFGIGKQVLTFTQHDMTSLSAEETLPILRHAHDELRRLVDEHPDRFVPVATIPFYTDEYVGELERALTELDMVGVQLFTNVDGRLLDADEVLPFYEMAEEANVPVWIHPRTYPGSDRTREYSTHKMLGWPFETSLAMVRLVFSGIVDRYRDLRFVTHHTGGMVPFFARRIQAYYEKEDEPNWTQLQDPVTSYLSRFYADTMIHGDSDALDFGFEFFDRGNLLFATDYPFGPDRGREYIRISVDGVEGMSCSPEEKERIYHGNVADLIPGV